LSLSPRLSVHLVLFASTLCFASLPVAGRLALGHVPAGAIPIVRSAGAALAFALIAWRRGTLRVDRADLPLIGLCTLLGMAANQELYIQGLARTTATNAVIVGATIGVFTALIAIALRREPVRVRRLLGMAIAFGGVAALVGAERVSTSTEHALGSVLILLNSASYAAYLVIGRPLAERYDPFALLAVMFLGALVMVAPFGAADLAAAAPGFSWHDYAFLAFLIAVPTVGGYTLVQVGLRRAESSLVAAYVYLQPVFTAVGAALVLDEPLDVRTILCGAIVLFGVWLAARSRP
jgi:drug/metabolite transporter (DMT)-like permease